MYAPQGRPEIGPALRRSLTEDADRWLARLFGDPGPGVALVAVGSLGRGELTPASDLDLLLLHANGVDAGAVADRVWYPVWDAGVGLDHSVRTVDQAVAAARDDLKVAVGLLDARLVAGDADLVAALRERALKDWRAGRWLPALRDSCAERAQRLGEVAFLLEPDLKSARGGLRDAQALWQVAATQRADRPGPEVVAAKEVLLDARGELQRRVAGDRLTMQEQDPVAADLGYADADALMRAVSAAGRQVAYALDVTWRAVLPAPAKGGFLRRGPKREPLADGVVSDGGEVVLAQGVRVEDDAELPLRVAAAAAKAGLPVSPNTLRRLASCPPLPEPWPASARDRLVALLSAGPAAVPVFEAFDLAGIWGRWLPEWDHTRSRPQRNAYHRYTVDRHLLEAAANAAALTRRVGRPDLLLLGALLHDIGKGLPGDHTEVGMEIVGDLGPRLGLTAADTATLQRMVEHHLLLADTAQRRDLDDPATITAVAEAVGDGETLDLLAALTEADSLATGPSAWSTWKAGLLARLVAQVHRTLGGTTPVSTPLTADGERLLAARAFALETDGDEVRVACPDRPGLIATVAGALALHRLEILSLTAVTRDAYALLTVVAVPKFGRGPDWELLRADLRRGLDDPGALAARVHERSLDYPRPVSAQPPAVSWVDDGVSEPVLEVRAPDGVGVLHRIAAAIELAGADVHSARCQTMGADVVDTFSVAEPGAERRTVIADTVLAALSA